MERIALGKCRINLINRLLLLLTQGDEEYTNQDRSKFKIYTPVTDTYVGGIGGGSFAVKGMGIVEIPAIVDR